MLDYVQIRRKARRFKLIKLAIDQLSPDGVYHYIGAADTATPVEYRATRSDLERVFSRAMGSYSYQKIGRFEQEPWELAEQFRIN